MRPVSLAIREFRGWRDAGVLPLDRALTLVVGANGRGKSSTVAAVEWCFYGAEVEKVKPIEIAERAEWEVRPREARSAPTEVTVVLEATGGGRFAVTRRRVAGAASRTPDEVEVSRPDGRILEGARATAWIAQHLPDLESFRRAHALHPEAVRRRATDKGDRSAVLAALLGLDEDRTLRRLLDKASGLDLPKAIDERLRTFEAGLLHAAARPARDRDEAEARLAVHGLRRADLSPSAALALRRRLTARAAALAARLGRTVELPDAEDAVAVLAWAPGWPASARGPAPALAGLMAKRQARAALEAGLTSLQPLEKELAGRRAAFTEAVRLGGDRLAREKARAEAEARWRASQHERKASGGLSALLTDARRALLGSGEGPCPVCGTPVEGLAARLDAELARLQGPEAVRLAAAEEDAHEGLERCRRALEQLDTLQGQGQAARVALDRARADLVAHLPPGAVAEGADAAALARARHEALGEEILLLERLVGERDDALRDHGRDVDVLRDLEAWARAVERLERDVDVAALPAHAPLQRAIDEAAAYASDLDALAAMAKEAQAERSRRRLAEANTALAGYFADIVGEDLRRGILVREHETAKGLDYHLLDADGEPILPVLNQASMNAVSIALLCAQAEARARAGGLAWALLDDPVQSLDDARQGGLARALERLAASCAVLVACTEGAFVARVRSHVACPRRLFHLGPRDAARGAWIAEVDEP